MIAYYINDSIADYSPIFFKHNGAYKSIDGSITISGKLLPKLDDMTNIIINDIMKIAKVIKYAVFRNNMYRIESTEHEKIIFIKDKSIAIMSFYNPMRGVYDGVDIKLEKYSYDILKYCMELDFTSCECEANENFTWVKRQ